MRLLDKTIAAIQKPNQAVHQEALQRLADQARPQGSLGILEPLSARLAAITGTLDVRFSQKIIVTCAGDHGVVEEGVSLFPQEVTPQMVYNFVQGGASVSVLAKNAGGSVRVADLGVKHDFPQDLPIFHKKIAPGTANFTKEPAMSREQAISSLEAGIEIVNQLADEEGLDLLGTGDMGIGNTTPSAAIIAAFSGLPVETVTGRGTGIDNEALANKVRVIEQGVTLHKPNPEDPLDVLAKVGGFEIGGLAGLVIGAAGRGIPVVCDGLISTAGALIACELVPTAKDYLIASHNSVEIGHRCMLERLGVQPLLNLDFRLGEGTGAAVSMHLIGAATRVLAEIKTFAEVGINDAQQQ
ncbi:nicotinate-nucleotide--dimethylbenzimidazole phosphoribosyltransferase [Desulfobulbus rhabdoformis]|uniref:nicotinate-nucleotide--dimethylbenzimidazole phosphoribosyltransferase n=1 Tax=Desulfobulbus rhabdoformis TaxID=34032 RepID=UPI00196443E3|nr:nicotinate-nucleotide--dimethylbenzimidazole phosphoribosyltransferase [Desulfobulbus rhabdoformis]MBM9615130.1 nicotinate-nucleotide--dimethylbenzimidazole phosphoribosyltransferase [Desulfobulbus rhabdoformis]